MVQLVGEEDSHQLEQDTHQFEEGSPQHVVSILCFEVVGLQFVVGSPYSDTDGCTLFVEELLGYIHQGHLDYIPKQREKCRLNYKKENTFGLIKAFSDTIFDIIVTIYHDKPLIFSPDHARK